MLGYEIFVYKQGAGGPKPATLATRPGQCLARWETGSGGLIWLQGLVAAHKAIVVGGDGYPFTYTAQAESLEATILEGPPGIREERHQGLESTLSRARLERMLLDRDELAKCDPEVWLLIEAWDQS